MLSHFQFTWQLQSRPRSLLSEPGWDALLPVKCLLSGCPKDISHLLSSSIYVAAMQQSHFRAAIVLLWPEPRLNTQMTHPWTLLQSHAEVTWYWLWFLHTWFFGKLAEIIKNFASSFTFSNSLDQAKLDTSSRYYGLFLLLLCMDYWIFGAPTTLSGSGRTLDERQTPRHPLAMLNAIRLVSFLQQGAFKQGLIIICLDKILICLMNLVLQEPWV